MMILKNAHTKMDSCSVFMFLLSCFSKARPRSPETLVRVVIKTNLPPHPHQLIDLHSPGIGVPFTLPRKLETVFLQHVDGGDVILCHPGSQWSGDYFIQEELQRFSGNTFSPELPAQ